jgi:hypothetical protein
MAKNDNDRHVVKNPEGGWDVKKEDAKRSSAHLPTQAQADKRAGEIVRNGGGGEVKIHGTDGKIRDSRTVPPGNDPFPPRDKK